MENKSAKADNFGHKWSLSALNRHLQCCKVDVPLMWSRIHDLVVKTLLSVERTIGARSRAAAPHFKAQNSCKELDTSQGRESVYALVREQLAPYTDAALLERPLTEQAEILLGLRPYPRES